jgi:hypothetical protein
MPCPIKLSDANKSFGVYIMPCPIKFIVTKEHFVDQVKKVCTPKLLLASLNLIGQGIIYTPNPLISIT